MVRASAFSAAYAGLVSGFCALMLTGCEEKVSISAIDQSISNAAHWRKVQYACYEQFKEDFRDLNFSGIKFCDELVSLREATPEDRHSVLMRLGMTETQAQLLFALEGPYALAEPPRPPERPESIGPAPERST